MLSTKERAELVGARIVAARRRVGMSQVALAEALAAYSGLKPETERRSLVNNETGRNTPRLHRLQAIAEATGQPLAFFAVEEGGGDAGGDLAPEFREAV